MLKEITVTVSWSQGHISVSTGFLGIKPIFKQLNSERIMKLDESTLLEKLITTTLE